MRKPPCGTSLRTIVDRRDRARQVQHAVAVGREREIVLGVARSCCRARSRSPQSARRCPRTARRPASPSALRLDSPKRFSARDSCSARARLVEQHDRRREQIESVERMSSHRRRRTMALARTTPRDAAQRSVARSAHVRHLAPDVGDVVLVPLDFFLVRLEAVEHALIVALAAEPHAFLLRELCASLRRAASARSRARSRGCGGDHCRAAAAFARSTRGKFAGVATARGLRLRFDAGLRRREPEAGCVREVQRLAPLGFRDDVREALVAVLRRCTRRSARERCSDSAANDRNGCELTLGHSGEAHSIACNARTRRGLTHARVEAPEVYVSEPPVAMHSHGASARQTFVMRAGT